MEMKGTRENRYVSANQSVNEYLQKKREGEEREGETKMGKAERQTGGGKMIVTTLLAANQKQAPLGK